MMKAKHLVVCVGFGRRSGKDTGEGVVRTSGYARKRVREVHDGQSKGRDVGTYGYECAESCGGLPEGEDAAFVRQRRGGMSKRGGSFRRPSTVD